MQVSRVSSCASWASCLKEKDSMHFRPGPTRSLSLLDLLQRRSNGQQTWRGVAKLQQSTVEADRNRVRLEVLSLQVLQSVLSRHQCVC